MAGKEFVSLDAQGVVKTLGLTLDKKSYSGDMDTLGHWYGKVGSDIVKIDVSGPSISATYSGQSLPGWDMAYNKNGNFYAVHSGTLYSFNTTTNTKSTLGSIIGATIPSGGFGAQWTGKDGYHYISHNSTGEVYRIDVNTREARFVLSSIDGLRFNDGFSCPLDIPAVYEYDHYDLLGYPIASHLTYAQDLNSDDIPDYKMVWLGTRVTTEMNAPANSIGNGDGGDDGIIYPSSFVTGGTSDIGVILNTNMTSQEVFYGMWIDWDDDKVFDDFYNGSSTISSQSELTQTVNVPVDFTSGNVAIRLRVGESAFTNADQGGERLLGEVEDYLFAATAISVGTKEISYIHIDFECDAARDGIDVYNEDLNTDLDNDSVADKNDPDPDDPNKTFVQYIPSQNSYGTLAFEDLWPVKGDYDFNDFIVEIKEKIVTNSNNDIYEITFDLRIMGMGGQYNNDFGITIDDPSNQITAEVFSPHNATFDISHQASKKIITIKKPKQLFYPNAITDIINAQSGATYYAPVELQIVLTLNGNLSYPNDYDPRFFIEQQGIDGHEVHLPGNSPSPRMNTGLFGTANDDTQPGNNKYYKSANNLPWVLYIPTSWNYPLEGVDLIEAYSQFQEYAEENPSLVWYLENLSDPTKTFNDH